MHVFQDTPEFSECLEKSGSNLNDAFCYPAAIVENASNVTDSKEIIPTYDKISQELYLRCSNLDAADVEFTKKLKKLTSSYNNVIGQFSSKLDKWSELRRQNVKMLNTSVQKFSLLKQTTTGITLISSALEFLLGLGGLMQGQFEIHLSPRCSFFMQALAGLSMTCSYSALLYSVNTTDGILKEIGNEKRHIKDLETVYRKGNWIDTEINDLFPHGIDLKLVKKFVFDAEGNLREPWRRYICLGIIMSNIKTDRQLLNNEKFLASVKTFLDSTASQILINRMKLRNLLDDMGETLENLPDKKSINCNEVFLNLAAINMPSVFYQFFCDSRMPRERRFLYSSLVAITAAFNFTASADRGFEDLKTASEELKASYHHIKQMSKNLVTDYD